ncbi:MAG: hypothetical protein RL748_4353 [Pseudomonadota bacterium]|jgi:hypothetical protein
MERQSSSSSSSASSQFQEKQQAFLHKLNSLDFGPLAYKLMNPEDRPGLSFEQSIDAIKKYKGFLALYAANPGKPISPSRYIDYVWHTHILDAELYTVQTGLLFGHYLQHFPFFGKRGEADEKQLLAAAEFTKSEALRYFAWDDDDWCGTGHHLKWPGPKHTIADLANVIFPAAANLSQPGSAQDSITIEVGNFRHTIQHFGGQTEPGNRMSLSRQDSVAQLLKLPIWVIVCFPSELNILDEMIVFQSRERLAEVAARLVKQRLAPSGFQIELVNLQLQH